MTIAIWIMAVCLIDIAIQLERIEKHLKENK